MTTSRTYDGFNRLTGISSAPLWLAANKLAPPTGARNSSSAPESAPSLCQCPAAYSAAAPCQKALFDCDGNPLWTRKVTYDCQTAHRPQSTDHCLPCDGNHNVVAYISAATGAMVAEYEYGPFGELLRATGPLAKDFNFLFSTKYHDWETGLYYYGYRYYNPSTGRWLSRDPIEERGGLNLYGLLNNDAIVHYDILGLVISIDPKDPFHPGGQCDENETCRDNLRLLIALINSSAMRLAQDFTPEFMKLAQLNAPIPKDKIYNPNVKDYRTSWNNHVDELVETLARATKCVKVIADQMKHKKCGCCDWFDDKRLRWREQEVQRMQRLVPDKVTKTPISVGGAAAFVDASFTYKPEAIGAAALLLVPGGEPAGAMVLRGCLVP